MNNSIAILVPCYNEELTISTVVNDFKKALPQAVIYVYDNASDVWSNIIMLSKWFQDVWTVMA